MASYNFFSVYSIARDDLRLSMVRFAHSNARGAPFFSQLLGTAKLEVFQLFLSIYLCILPTLSQAFLAGTARQGHEKKKAKSMIVSLFQDDRLKLER